ncbi:type VI secretion system baseplate subunit TssK [Sphingomonas sp. BK235]|uniref:type VI secretion system baseplate subunit TssK n=1 Tax=Sphingomonas sp. BK235 TaxID=2512131 RepID=UPI0010516D36|nr:type VI secretion system baseplate subunit TssK [Sphingomonas sp. BK235]TCP33683.1 type VI secretion system protein ImpJ [Sphingomonas sp. BK235]
MLAEGRVAWREGLFLRQQHFQQQDRHLDALLGARARTARPYPWGVTELVVNQDLAALGKFGVERLAGVLPDGMPFAIPGDLPPPAPIDLPATTRDAVVHLTLPAHQPGAVAYRVAGEPGAAEARFLVEVAEVPDVFAEERAREPVEIARPNLAFGVTRDQTYGRVLLGLARVRETNNGALVFDDRYVPPAIDVAASPRLTGFLADILGRAEQRIDELALRAVEAADAGTETIANFLLLQTLNRCQAQLAHLAALPMLHPERLYEALLALAGELATLTSAERRPGALPRYAHDRLQQCFEPVVERIQVALSAIYDRAATMLPLVEAAPGAYTARIADPALLGSSYLFLAASARAPLDEVRARFPSVAKIGPVQKMRQIVDSALAGVPLRHAPTPPPQIRAIPGYVYFELDRSSEQWAALADAPALGLHVAGDWPELRLELWCVRRAAR